MTYTPDSQRALVQDAVNVALRDVINVALRDGREAEQELAQMAREDAFAVEMSLKADNAALRERLDAAMVLLAENVVDEGETGDCCTYCGGIATYTAKGDGSPGTWNVNHRQDCRYAALEEKP